ncbi:uncharacterized protein CLUP02_16394 [Colletotrichum lupini]|uniref:Uncharacterized protein n=1 Tax=Colletotrichum lupini TaxID=145971 RepID=A0A9Q8WPX8_9PEZI|nr:uncharacterized protein CLUP02_16394 [Colletotrichum lupini]UQC90862.1 hypothetical protein CLUP02_16394 [Colletotrichum lupini]
MFYSFALGRGFRALIHHDMAVYILCVDIRRLAGPSLGDASLGFPCLHYPRLVGVAVESDAPEALSVSHFDWIAQLFWKRQETGLGRGLFVYVPKWKDSLKVSGKSRTPPSHSRA